MCAYCWCTSHWYISTWDIRSACGPFNQTSPALFLLELFIPSFSKHELGGFGWIPGSTCRLSLVSGKEKNHEVSWDHLLANRFWFPNTIFRRLETTQVLSPLLCHRATSRTRTQIFSTSSDSRLFGDARWLKCPACGQKALKTLVTYGKTCWTWAQNAHASSAGKP